MNGLWQRAAARVNAMTLRERLLLFTTVMLALGAATEVFFIAPLNRLQAQRARQLEASSAAMESQRARIEHDLAQSRIVRANELRADIANVQAQIDAVDGEIAALSAEPGDAAALRAVLARVPRRADKVALLKVTAVDAVSAPVPGVAMAPIGLDITLGGGYLDLMDYLATLEAALPKARWGALRFNAEIRPAQATVRIVTPRTVR